MASRLTPNMGDDGDDMETAVETGPLRATVTIRNPQGLHMRPAMMFARLAARYKSAVSIRKGERAVNGKSLLQLMTLAAMPGTELDLEVSGDDAATALPLLAAALGAPSAETIEST